MAAKRKREPMPQEELHKTYPSTRILASNGSQEAWEAAFNARPGAMHSLLADFIKQVYAKPGRIGQRPMPREEEVDFNALLFATDNTTPLVDVVKEGMVSERALAAKLYMSRSTLQRLLAGKYEPTVSDMRQIAKALGKPVAYFPEYRKAMAMAAFEDMIDKRPGIATHLYRKYIEVRHH